MAGRSATRYSGWRAALDPARTRRASVAVSVWSIAAALGIGCLLVGVVVYDPGAFDRIQDHAPLQPSMLDRARAEAPHDIDGGIAALAARLERAPEDVDGWALLARSYTMIGDQAGAADASLRVAALRARDPGQLARTAELRISEANGIVEPDARRLVEATLAMDPTDPRARFFRGLAQAQADQPRQALATWLRLEADSAPDASWLDGLRAMIDRVVDEAEIDAATLAQLRAAAAAEPPP